ncbi:MAG: beta-propeller fold lactonase family protein, partial [Maioricimonas sp. JB049]
MSNTTGRLQHTRQAVMLTAAILVACGSAPAGTSNSLMDISADGTLLACSNRDSGTVTIVDLKTHTVLHEVAIGHHPEGVSFIGSSHALAVAVHGEDRIEFLDADNGKATGRVDVFDEPYGVVSSGDGTRVFVTLDYPGQVLEIDPVNRAIVRTLDVGRFIRGIALEPDGRRLLTTEYYSGIVRAIDLDTWEVVDEWVGSSQENLARQIAVHPTRPKAYLPMQRSRVTVPHGSGAIFPYVAIVDTAAGEGKRRKRVQMDSFRGTYVVANPWEVAVSPDGQRLYAAFAGTDDLFVCNVLDDNYRELEYAALLQLGANPRAVRVAPDGQTFYVYNALDFEVVAYDASTLQERARLKVCENPLDEELWLGKRLFYSARQPMVGRRWISCSSCHPDGQPDGRTWQQPEGLRQTQPLFGMAHTHPIHWSADRDEVQDFEHAIRGPLMQGRGLIRGKLNDSLGEPNKGLSRELDALAAYANSHDVPLSPYAKNGL